MKNKLLIFISIFILNIQYIQADSLPALPELASSSIEQTNTENQKEQSFWQKILSFFGFGDDNKSTEQETQITEEDNKSAVITQVKTTKNLINAQTLEEEFVIPSLDAIEDKNTTIETAAINETNSESPHTITNTDSKLQLDNIQDSTPELITTI
jgi:hypothetical protein